MNLQFIRQSPFRRPQWRMDRVMQMLGNRPQPLRPTRHDDHNIRIYRQILIDLGTAKDDESRRDEIFREYPEVCRAHLLHYSPDVESRQILEASLLTTKSFTEIANRFATEPRAIEYFEGLFFNVRDRLSSSFWIRQVIRGRFDTGRDVNDKNLRLAQRGYVLRLFAFFGGPLVLDAMVQGLSATKTPPHEQDVSGWFADALGQLVRSSAAAAASTIEMNQKTMTQMIKLAFRARAAAPKTGKGSPSAPSEETLEKILAAVEGSIASRELPETAKASGSN
jgi:hypothetical protein